MVYKMPASMTLLLALASPALADATRAPVRCTSTYSRTLNRYDILCSDGTRGLST
jgi:hypothetical protein